MSAVAPVNLELTYDQMMDEAKKRFEKQLVGFDPAIIIAIISAIMQLLGGKKSKGQSDESIQSCCKRKGFGTRVLLNYYLTKQGIPNHVLNSAIDAAFNVGSNATAQEFKTTCNYAVQMFAHSQGRL